MKIKKIICFFLISLFLTSSFSPLASYFASQSPGLSFETLVNGAPGSNAAPGDEIEVIISINNYKDNTEFNEIEGLQINIPIDIGIVTYVPNSGTPTIVRTEGGGFYAGVNFNQRDREVIFVYYSTMPRTSSLRRDSTALFKFKVRINNNVTSMNYAFNVSRFETSDINGNTNVIAVKNGPSVDIKSDSGGVAITKYPTASGVYGSSLSSLGLTGGSANTDGTWSWDEPNAAGIYPSAGNKNAYKAKFTPSGAGLEAVQFSVTPSITKKNIAVSVENKSRRYGEENPALTFTFNNNDLVGSDTINDLGITLSCTADKTSAEGSYTITGTSNSSNYNVSITPGTLTVKNSQSSLVTVSVTVSGGGTASGGGTFNVNDTVNLTAVPNSSYHFDGWYESGVKVSSETSYSFTVTANRTIQARFTYSGTGQSHNGGGSSGGSSSGGSSSGSGASTDPIISNPSVSNDDSVISQISSGNEPTLQTSASTNSVLLTSKGIKAVYESGKRLIITHGNMAMVMSNEFLKSLDAGSIDNIEAEIMLTRLDVGSDVLNVDPMNKALSEYIYEIGINVNGKPVNSFTKPIILYFKLANSKLSDGQKSKLTGVHFLTDGNHVQLGGSVIGDTLQFNVFSADKYGMLITDRLVKIRMTIGKTEYYLDDKVKTTDVAPIIINNRTMVPVRFIAEAFGAEVSWDDKTKTAGILLDSKFIQLQIGKILHGMDVAPVIVNSRTLVPLRYISEQFNASVVWDEKTRSISIVR